MRPHTSRKPTLFASTSATTSTSSMARHRPLTSLLATLCTALLATAPAWADDEHAGRSPALTPQYRQECGACHTAYAPALLPAASWQRIMKGLDRHYGSDASMDAATTRQISGWLQANAGSGRRISQDSPPQDRITRAAWFEREHRHIPAAAWTHRSVGSAANCAACHTDADQGQFSEHSLRVPPGLERLVGRAWEDD
jgi:mono/diheme cytochrome c family protein